MLSRITNDVDTISNTLNQSLTQIITAALSLIGITVMMLTISWQMTLVTLCVLPVSMISVMFIVKKSQVHFKNQQMYLGKVNGHVEEMLGSHILVKAFNGEEESAATMASYNDALYNSAWKANFLSGLMMPIAFFIGNLAYVAIVILGGILTANGTITIGGIQAFIQYARQFNQPISQVAQLSNVLQQTAAAAERVFEFLGEKEEVAEAPNAFSVNQTDAPPIPTLRSTSKVPSSSTMWCSAITRRRSSSMISIAHIKPGQKVAIVGPTGAGKDHDCQAPHALLRCQQRLDFDRRS